jgi:hypothetical protein
VLCPSRDHWHGLVGRRTVSRLNVRCYAVAAFLHSVGRTSGEARAIHWEQRPHKLLAAGREMVEVLLTH